LRGHHTDLAAYSRVGIGHIATGIFSSVCDLSNALLLRDKVHHAWQTLTKYRIDAVAF
jgi:hypothetical protein